LMVAREDTPLTDVCWRCEIGIIFGGFDLIIG
jgi:hypothetical protein